MNSDTNTTISSSTNTTTTASRSTSNRSSSNSSTNNDDGISTVADKNNNTTEQHDDNNSNNKNTTTTATTTTTTTTTYSQNNEQQQRQQQQQERHNDDAKKDDVRKVILWEQFKQESTTLFLSSIALIVSTLSNQAIPRLMGQLIDNSSSSSSNNNNSSTRSNASSTSSTTTTVLLYVVVSGAIASFVRTMLLVRVQENIIARLRTTAFTNLLVQKSDHIVFKEEREQRHDDDDDDDTNDSVKRDTTTATTTNASTTINTTSTTTNSTNTSDATNNTTMILSPSVISNILNEDVTMIAKTISSTCTNLIRGCCSVLFSAYHMIVLDSSLFATSLSIIPSIGIVAILLRKRTNALIQKQIQCNSRATSFVEERLHNLDLIQLSNREVYELTNYSSQYTQTIKSIGYQIGIVSGQLMGFLVLATSSSLFLVVQKGIHAVLSKRISSGQLTTFVTYSFLLGLGTSSITKSISELSKGIISSKRYYQLINNNNNKQQQQKQQQQQTENDTTTTTIMDNSTSLQVEGDGQKKDIIIDLNKVTAVSMKNVSFTYNNNKNNSNNKLVLNNVSITLQRGKVIALIGKNGSGKSTCAKLLTGLLSPLQQQQSSQNGGQIQIICEGETNEDDVDGITEYDLSQISKSCKKDIVQIIPQNVALFNTSIYDNVTYCHPDATIEEVNNVLEQCNCTQFIQKLPNGINTIVGWNGHFLSGGERQRIALARSFLCQSPILLIMDEPTLNLDMNGVETIIREAVQTCKQNNTALLIITHDSTILQYVDEMIVLKNGIIVEKHGTLQEFITNTTNNHANSELCQLMPGLLSKLYEK